MVFGASLDGQSVFSISASADAGAGKYRYDYTIRNRSSAPIWTVAVRLNTAVAPAAVSSPSGWVSQTVVNQGVASVIWWTSGSGGISANDFGNSVISAGETLSGFSVVSSLAPGPGTSTAVLANGDCDSLQVDVPTDASMRLRPAIDDGGVVPLSSTISMISVGSWISLYGENFVGSTSIWNGEFPTSLGGVSVSIDGHLAYIWYVDPSQINAQVPDQVSKGEVSIVVTTPYGSAVTAVTVGDVSPSLSRFDGKYLAGVIPTSDGSGGYGEGAYDLLGPAGHFIYETRPVKSGETLELYGVGFGPTSPRVAAGQSFSGGAATTNAVTVTIGGVAASVSFSGLVGPGLYQINVLVPSVGGGDQLVVATVGGVKTPGDVYISVQ